MKLFKIWQTENDGYDTYDSAIVATNSKAEARLIHPSGKEWDGQENDYSTWCGAFAVKVIELGTAIKGTEKGVICASFNAG